MTAEQLEFRSMRRKCIEIGVLTLRFRGVSGGSGDPCLEALHGNDFVVRRQHVPKESDKIEPSP
ncbi:MAG: hypothetical protein F4186_05140 [Boseongicola sp. SB0676_bin_33]|nr:hypothetical protein [Boseongicola sp. SB0676_bin_33]